MNQLLQKKKRRNTKEMKLDLDLAQTKLIGLTMKLDLKSREYKILCNRLEKYKNAQINENDERLYQLLVGFQKNHDEIVEIKRQLSEIEDFNETKKENNDEKFDYETLFKPKKTTNTDESNYNQENKMIEYKESLWERIKKKLKKIFKFY